MEERPSRRKARARVRGLPLSPLAAEARRRDGGGGGGGGGAREAASEQAQGAERGAKPQQAHEEHATEHGSEWREQQRDAADADEWRNTAFAVVRTSAATVIVGALCVLAAPTSLRAAETHVRSSREATAAAALSTASLTAQTTTPALASSTTAANAAATLAASDFRYSGETWGDAAVGFFFYQCAPCPLIRLSPALWGPNAKSWLTSRCEQQRRVFAICHLIVAAPLSDGSPAHADGSPHLASGWTC